jgi:hypothetical protein
MTPGLVTALLLLLAGLAGLGCLFAAFRALRRQRLIDDVPTSKAQGVFIGLVELKGTAETESPLTSYLAGLRCVQYVWKIEEQWSRTVHETYTDAQGHIRSRTRTETGWNRVAGGEESPPFYLKDDTGVIRIDPTGATIHPATTFDQTWTPKDDLYFGKGPPYEIANTSHRRRFHETALPLHTVLYVMGQSRERTDVVAAELARDKSAPMFLISTRTERQISSGYQRWLWFWLVLGLVLAAAGAVISRIATGTAVNWPPLVYAGLVYLAAAALGWLGTVFNSLVNLHHMAEQGWSQVDIQLKRRHDLIPNLVTAVQGYRGHEAETQRLLADLRTQGEATALGVAGPDFKGISPALHILVERYPELKANESFLRLQQSLVETEQRIALARDYFNSVATFYNTRLEIIPDRFVAALGRFRPSPLMSAADFERAPVQVHLAD